MPSEQRLADYLAGALAGQERAAFEAELAADPEALRELVQQRRLDAALGALLDPNAARIEAAIMASVLGASDSEVEARVLETTVFGSPSGRGRSAISTIGDWFSTGMRWRWARVAAAVLLIGVFVGVLWVGPWMKSIERRPPVPDLANANPEPELLRELAPLVAPPPVWTGLEQQSAWLTALAGATAPAENRQ
jgi:anti-sigma-K factor RskA